MKKTYIFLTLCGVLFSGYLSAVKFFSETCAFNESCPYLMGYPACYYGFTIFLLMFIYSIYSFISNIEINNESKILSIISLFGITFSGYFVIIENFEFSTCTLGLIFYLIIFMVSLRNSFKKNDIR